jgi:enoyl-CoA hydratase/carnithine racemase
MMDNLVKVKVHAPSGTIILQRPEKRNALSRLMMLQIQQAFDDLHQERKVRAVILTGAGTAFCAGIDLAEIHATLGTTDVLEQWYRDTMQLKELLETMLRFPKPIIAAVNGPAVGAGAGLVLASDIVLGTPPAQFGLPEARRGLVAGIVSPLLSFRVGAGYAANLLLTAQLVSAQDALQRGIYHQLVPFDQAWAAAHEIACQCARSSSESIQLTKRMLNETIGEHLSTLLNAGAAVAATARTTEAAEEGLAAFVEKREPQWK